MHAAMPTTVIPNVAKANDLRIGLQYTSSSTRTVLFIFRYYLRTLIVHGCFCDASKSICYCCVYIKDRTI
jgi:hypothetical protein